MPVQYRQSEWRSKFDNWFDAFIEAFSAATDTERNWRIALDALTVTTTAWALTAKLPKWEREQEVRMIFLVREDAAAPVRPTEEVRADGTLKRYLTVPVTALRRMPIVEVIAGPNNDPATAQERAIRMLQGAGYPAAEAKVVVSNMVLDCESMRD
jgi:hypothetical protein